MSSVWTVRQAVDRIVEAGLADQPTVARELEPTDLDESLDYFGEPDGAALVSLLDRLRIAYTLDYKVFRGTHEDGLEIYREELEWIAGRSRGLFTVTDVELVDADDEHLLRFRCNGQPHEWPISHHDDGEREDYEAQLTFATYLTDLEPARSPARWCTVEPLKDGDPLVFVLGEPAPLRELGQVFGVTFAPDG